ncbi:zinc finger MYM-type protein 1-like [Metopolophium dirhodum]|uniref:zinc finger MYM-type protein 1-like n=1 Tax=Metopolophium dirhodum TaxID=44670 RepID=UPI00298FF535|nr:zinc finger MYM-type protein 1-like [Metopolophium dirhodum]
MSKRIYVSGWDKHKKKMKQQNENNIAANVMKSWIKKSVVSNTSDAVENDPQNEIIKENDSSEVISNTSDAVENDPQNEIIKENDSSEDFGGLNLTLKYPTDRGHFEGEVCTSLKKSILLFGQCKPSIKFPRNHVNRCFSTGYYYITTKTGIKIPRQWLCYSLILDKAYCEFCWLFANRQYEHFKYEWISGVDDWQHLSQQISKHENSIQHINATEIRRYWEKNKTLDTDLEKQISEEAEYWRNVLRRVIHVILTLTSGNTALRGNEGKKGNLQEIEGDFMRTIRLLAKFDPFVHNLLNDSKKHVKYLSWKIQDELIEILASDVRNSICDEVKKCSWFSIILDSTQDITKIDQVSVIIRYVFVEYENHTLDIRESFLGFFALQNHGSSDYAELLLKILTKFGLDIKKCRDQGYDGASVMSGAHFGVQKRIINIVPTALYVHCCAHNLNLVISDAAKTSQKIVSFFSIVQDVFNFFGSSAPRWEARHDAVFSLQERFIDVVKCLTKISLTTKKTDERNSSLTLKKKILNVVSKLLQGVNYSIEMASTLMNQSITQINELRNNYDGILSKSKELCAKWNITVPFHLVRKQFANKRFDDFDGDFRLDINEENFKIKVFLPVLDTILFQLHSRFEGMVTILHITKIDKTIVSELKTIQNLAFYIIDMDLSTSFPDVLAACLIFLTIPVTVASAERSFSKLKLIKNYLRNSIGQERLCGISILNIERRRTSDIDIEKIIDNFAYAKARKKQFF